MRALPTGILIATAILALLAAKTGSAERDPALAGFFAAIVSVESRDGERHKFTAYLALTEQQKVHGLMFVKTLPDNHGMLFLYDEPQKITMWMKNTILPLDMLFIRADGIIVNIESDTVPQSLALVSSAADATAVLELKAGTSKRLGLQAGDRVIYRAFNRPASDRVRVKPQSETQDAHRNVLRADP